MTEVNYVRLTDLTTEGGIIKATLSTKAEDDASGKTHSVSTRIVVLFLLFILGLVGNTFALLWIWSNRKRKSRINNIVLGLATADLSVCVFTMFVSLVYELQDYHWYAGNVGCKIIMAFQTASIMASSFMLVIMAVDRHQAIRAPLKEGFSVKRMIISAWVLSLLLSIPQMIVWYVHDDPGFETCRTNLKETPYWRVVYVLFGAMFSFFIPLSFITVAYIRLSKKIWDKAQETSGKGRPSSSKKRKICMQSTGSSSLNRAKIKTLKMSAVIIVMFVLCGLPYFAVEMVQSLMFVEGESSLNPKMHAIFGIFAVSNSAVNPFVFLLFNKRTKCLKLLRLGPPDDPSTKKRRLGSHGASTSSYSRDDTTKTILESKTQVRGDVNSHDARGHGNQSIEIRMEPIREDCQGTNSQRDFNWNM